MGKWLEKFSGKTLEDQTDKTDILPSQPSVSGMSVPLSGILPKISIPHPSGEPSMPRPLVSPRRVLPAMRRRLLDTKNP